LGKLLVARAVRAVPPKSGLRPAEDLTMMARRQWREGWDDLVPLSIWALPMLGWALLAGPRAPVELFLVIVAIGIGFALKHLLPSNWEDLALVAPVLILLIEFSTVRLTVDGIFLAALAGVGLLVWAGAEATSGVSLVQLLEPAIIPALAVGVAVAVMLFLPRGSGGQVGIAALILVAVLGLSAWLYLRSAAEVTDAQSTS
jgi:hypothetical protein